MRILSNIFVIYAVRKVIKSPINPTVEKSEIPDHLASEKPADLDLDCFQNRISGFFMERFILDSSIQRLKWQFILYFVHFSFIQNNVHQIIFKWRWQHISSTLTVKSYKHCMFVYIKMFQALWIKYSLNQMTVYLILKGIWSIFSVIWMNVDFIAWLRNTNQITRLMWFDEDEKMQWSKHFLSVFWLWFVTQSLKWPSSLKSIW